MTFIGPYIRSKCGYPLINGPSIWPFSTRDNEKRNGGFSVVDCFHVGCHQTIDRKP